MKNLLLSFLCLISIHVSASECVISKLSLVNYSDDEYVFDVESIKEGLLARGYKLDPSTANARHVYIEVGYTADHGDDLVEMSSSTTSILLDRLKGFFSDFESEEVRIKVMANPNNILIEEYSFNQDGLPSEESTSVGSLISYAISNMDDCHI